MLYCQYLKKICEKIQEVKNLNSNKLKGVIVSAGETQAQLAEAMGISLSRLNAKINETGAEFTQREISFIRDRYNLSDSQITDIFFCK